MNIVPRQLEPSSNAFLQGQPLSLEAPRISHTRSAVTKQSSEHHHPMTSSVISHATKNIGLTIHELLDMAELMRVAYEKDDWESVQNKLALLVRDAASLASSVADILDLKEIEADRVAAIPVHFDIIALLREVTDSARALAKDKVITIMDASCPSPVVIHADPSIIRQIMTGLVSNAVKFTDRGRVAIILSKENGAIRLTVADTGRGMTREQINAVFGSEPGYTGKTTSLAPSGLGHTIINKLVRKVGGNITVSSKVGGGTIVEVTLPLSLSGFYDDATARLNERNRR
jgi:signal transduction histidine kinase